eukprot:m.217901 g.217901  ORF g.217901 m.217901 type:complete len:109 (-) comp15893_c0_seq1:256-582(-)
MYLSCSWKESVEVIVGSETSIKFVSTISTRDFRFLRSSPDLPCTSNGLLQSVRARPSTRKLGSGRTDIQPKRINVLFGCYCLVCIVVCVIQDSGNILLKHMLTSDNIE